MSLPLVYSPDYVAPLPPEHRFPMPKFGRVYEVLIQDGIATPDQFHCPEMAPFTWLELAHTSGYVQAYCAGSLSNQEVRRIGLPWHSQLVRRTRTAVAGTVLTAELALAHGLACNTAGGTHHAHSDFGSGFCIFNDLAVAARVIQTRGLAHRILVVDLDVHQGDGTAAIFAGDESVFAFSMHCEKNFPFRKMVSDLDIGLDIGLDDDAYLAILSRTLPDLLDQVRPELVFYDAGVDPHHADRLGKLALTDAGIYQRDLYVLKECTRQGYPVATVIGGGYSRDISALARRHALVHRAATEIFPAL